MKRLPFRALCRTCGTPNVLLSVLGFCEDCEPVQCDSCDRITVASETSSHPVMPGDMTFCTLCSETAPRSCGPGRVVVYTDEHGLGRKAADEASLRARWGL